MTIETEKQLRLWSQMTTIDAPQAKMTPVKPIPDDLWQTLPDIEPKLCFHNAYQTVIDPPDNNARYVLGYAHSGLIPVEHAWVKLNDTYYDPTWEVHGEIGTGYLALIEFDRIELLLFMSMHNQPHPPDIHACVRHQLLNTHPGPLHLLLGDEKRKLPVSADRDALETNE